MGESSEQWGDLLWWERPRKQPAKEGCRRVVPRHPESRVREYPVLRVVQELEPQAFEHPAFRGGLVKGERGKEKGARARLYAQLEQPDDSGKEFSWAVQYCKEKEIAVVEVRQHKSAVMLT